MKIESQSFLLILTTGHMLSCSSLLSIFIVKISSPRHFKWSHVVEEKVDTFQYISKKSLTLEVAENVFFSRTAFSIIQWVARGGAILNIFLILYQPFFYLEHLEMLCYTQGGGLI